MMIKIIIYIGIFLSIVFLLSRGHVYRKNELKYGVTFSAKQAIDLGLDWRRVYKALLNDLGVKNLRLSAYWDEVEPRKGEFRWDDLDWQLNQAAAAGAKVILAVGGRLPRWPECHFPDWTKNLSTPEREQETLNYIETTVKRYLGREEITAWQIENEPFLPHFGICPKLDKKFFDKEIALVRSLDDRPIIITDSGELSIWVPAARRADIFGTTMYRDTYSKNLKRYIHYPITPGFFRLKRNLVGLFAHPKKWIVIELEAEPWASVPYQDVSRAEREKTMSPQKFKDILEFARQAGFREFYLWGVEYWYWEKTVNNYPAFWDQAKKIF